MGGLLEKSGKTIKNTQKHLISNGYGKIRGSATIVAYYPVVNFHFSSLSSRLRYLDVMVRPQTPRIDSLAVVIF
jgi:hypothetical protein